MPEVFSHSWSFVNSGKSFCRLKRRHMPPKTSEAGAASRRVQETVLIDSQIWLTPTLGTSCRMPPMFWDGRTMMLSCVLLRHLTEDAPTLVR